MKYRDIIGYTKKNKKVITEQKKPKTNKVIDGIKRELNEWSDTTFRNNPKRWSNSKGLTEFEKQRMVIREVGSAPQHKKFLKNIEKAEENLHKHVLKYKYFLQDQDLKDEANEFSSKYTTFVGKFTHFTKTTWVKMLRKMI